MNLVINFMKKAGKSILSAASENFFGDKHVVKIEGGLGSQILGAFEYFTMQEIHKEKVFADVEYFRTPANRKNSTVSLWPWQLTRYGISMQDFAGLEEAPYLLRFRNRHEKNWASSEDWQKIRFELISKFPIDELEFNFKKRQLGLDTNFGVIHIRRGDYFKVASKLVEYDTYLNLLRSIKPLMPKHLILVSDSEIPRQFQEKIKDLVKADIHVLDSASASDSGFLHDLMRNADLLVTSNSTFSFTAGVLSKPGTVVFTPVDFFGAKKHMQLNQNFLSTGQFFMQQIPEESGKIHS
jgi:hypothetical protein